MNQAWVPGKVPYKGESWEGYHLRWEHFGIEVSRCTEAADPDNSGTVAPAVHNGRDPQKLRCLRKKVILHRPGEVVDEFPDNETAIQLLMASCHIPGVCGMLPKNVGGKHLSSIELGPVLCVNP